MTKISNFFVLRWSIIAGPVKYIKYIPVISPTAVCYKQPAINVMETDVAIVHWKLYNKGLNRNYCMYSMYATRL